MDNTLNLIDINERILPIANDRKTNEKEHRSVRMIRVLFIHVWHYYNLHLPVEFMRITKMNEIILMGIYSLFYPKAPLYDGLKLKNPLQMLHLNIFEKNIESFA